MGVWNVEASAVYIPLLSPLLRRSGRDVVEHERRALVVRHERQNSEMGGQAQPSKKKEKKNTIGGDPKICAPKVGKVNEGSLEEK